MLLKFAEILSRGPKKVGAGFKLSIEEKVEREAVIGEFRTVRERGKGPDPLSRVVN